MAESRERYMDKYRDEIISLYRDRRYTKERIRRTLEDKHGVELPKSTFGRYVNSIPELKQALESLPPEAEHFIEQKEVYDTIIDGIKTTRDLAAQLHGRMGVLEDATAERHKALVEAIQQLSRQLVDGIQERHEVTVQALQQFADALSAIQARTQGLEPAPDTRPALQAIQQSLQRQAVDITAIRRSVGPIWSMVQRNAPWMKAFGLTGLFWAAVIAGVMTYYRLWNYLPWRVWRSYIPF
jgi:hypothetical protein